VATTKNAKKSTAPASRSGLKSRSPPPPLPSSSSVSPMAQSWSHFSRSFVPSCSVQHASSRYSQEKSKRDNTGSSNRHLQNRAYAGKGE
jgi:hypothetical protein